MASRDGLVLGIDLGGTDCKFGVVDSKGRVIRKARHRTQNENGPEQALALIAAHAREILGSDSMSGVGMGVPGPMSSREGIVFQAPNLQGWIDIPVREILETRLGIPVELHNDANAAAYGEYWAGAGRGACAMVLFTLGTGIGGGIIIDGELYTGPDDTAGELGHMIINFEGPPCGCGSHGCLEAYASATAIRRTVREAVASGQKTSIHIPKGREHNFGAKAVYDAAESGDKFAQDVLWRAGVALGIGAANIINIFNPDVIVYSGAMTHAGDYIFDSLRQVAHERSFKKPSLRVKITIAELGEDAGIIGAAGLALKKLQQGG